MKLLLITAILLASACSVGSAQMSQEKRLKDLEEATEAVNTPSIESTLLQSAREAVDSGNHVKAEYYYSQLIERKPNNDEYKYQYAEILRKLGRADAALPVFEKLKENPDLRLDATESAALSQLLLGKNAEASENLKIVIESDPTRWKALNAAALIFAADGKFIESGQYLEAAATASNYNPAVLNNQGLIKALVGNYTDAIKILADASARAVNSPEQKKNIDMNLALVYGISGNMAEAERIARLHLNEAEVYNNLGVYAGFAKNKELAKTYLNKALSEVPVYYDKAWKNLDKIKAGN